MGMIKDILMYMDRTYVNQNKIKPIYNLSLEIFRYIIIYLILYISNSLSNKTYLSIYLEIMFYIKLKFVIEYV
jgi:hypothetical protein